MKKDKIPSYLEALEKQLLLKKNERPIELTREWVNTFTPEAGVYLIRENGVVCYIGETGSIRGRMSDLLNTKNHVIRKSIVHYNLHTHPNYRKASSKDKFHDDIEILVETWMREKLTISVLPIEFGRKEFEEYIHHKHKPKYNNKGKRLSKLNKHEKFSKTLKNMEWGDEKIAILAWGSLYWDPRELKTKGSWRYDGPSLPIEFARISRDKRITLVIKPGFAKVKTLYIESEYNSLSEAKKNLQQREGITKDTDIGFFNFTSGEYHINRIEEEIKEELISWNKDKNFSAVIWTDLGANFFNATGLGFHIENIKAYLNSLSIEQYAAAKKYIHSAPDPIQTQFRPEIETFLNSK